VVQVESWYRVTVLLWLGTESVVHEAMRKFRVHDGALSRSARASASDGIYSSYSHISIAPRHVITLRPIDFRLNRRNVRSFIEAFACHLQEQGR
jgi:hypothetical protein